MCAKEGGHDANGHVKNSAANRCGHFLHAVYPRRDLKWENSAANSFMGLVGMQSMFACLDAVHCCAVVCMQLFVVVCCVVSIHPVLMRVFKVFVDKWLVQAD